MKENIANHAVLNRFFFLYP